MRVLLVLTDHTEQSPSSSLWILLDPCSQEAQTQVPLTQDGTFLALLAAGCSHITPTPLEFLDPNLT